LIAFTQLCRLIFRFASAFLALSMISLFADFRLFSLCFFDAPAFSFLRHGSFFARFLHIDCFLLLQNDISFSAAAIIFQSISSRFARFRDAPRRFAAISSRRFERFQLPALHALSS